MFFGGCAFLVWSFNRPPRAYYLANSLQEGMTKHEVRKILGKPDSDFGHSFAYNRPLSWGIYYVIFDNDGKLKEHYYDP